MERIASHLETEVARLHNMLEAAQSANQELERQSSRLSKLEMERGIYHECDGHQVGTNMGEQPTQNVSAFSPHPSQHQQPQQETSRHSFHHHQQQQQQQRTEHIYLPRPHSRSSSPVILPMGGLPQAIQTLQPLPVAASRVGAAEPHNLSKGSLRASQQQPQQQPQQHSWSSYHDMEALKGQVAWHEREKTKAQQQVNRIYDELEEARAEAAHLRQLLHDKEGERQRQDKALAEGREEARERQERLEAAQAERDDLAGRLRVLEKEKVEMRQHITKLDMYLVNMARELDESRDTRTSLGEKLQHLTGENEKREGQVTELSQDLQTLSKWVQRTQGTKKSFDRVLENLQGLIDRLKSAGLQETTSEMCRQLSSGSQQAASPGFVEGVVSTLRKLSSETHTVTLQLADEVAAGRRECDFIANDLNDLTTRLRKAAVKAQQNSSTDKRGGTTEGGGPQPSLSERLRILDEVADETGQHLRKLLRARVSHVQGLLRTAYETQADMAAENERLKRDAKGSAARIAVLEEDLVRLHKEAEGLTEQLSSLMSKEKTAEEVLQLQEPELGGLRLRITHAQVEASSLRDVIEQLRATLSDVMASKGHIETELSQMQDVAAARATDLEAAREENAALLRRIKDLQEAADAAKHREEGEARGQAEELEALNEAQEANVWRQERLLELLARARARYNALRILGAWARTARKASARKSRLGVMVRAVAMVRGEQAEAQRLVEELSRQVEDAAGENEQGRARAIDLEEEVEAGHLGRERVGELLCKNQMKRWAVMVLRAWAKAARDAAKRRANFRSSFRQHVAGKRLRLERTRTQELEAWLAQNQEELERERQEVQELRSTLTQWVEEGADPEQRAQLEQETHGLVQALEQAKEEAKSYREQLESLREAAGAKERDLEQQVEALVREQEEQLEAAREESEGEKQATARHVRSLEAQVSTMRTDLEERRASAQQVEAELLVLRQRVQEDSIARAAVASREAEAQRVVEEARAALGRLQEEAATREQRLADREGQLTALRSQAEEMARRVEELQQILQKKEEAHAARQRQWEEELNQQRLESEVMQTSLRRAVEAEVAAAHREEVSRLEEEMDRAVVRQREAEGEVESLRHQARRMEDERARWAAKHKELEHVLCATRDEYMRLQEVLPRMEEQLAEARDALSRSQGEHIANEETSPQDLQLYTRDGLGLSPSLMSSGASDDPLARSMEVSGGGRLPIFSAYGAAEPEETQADLLAYQHRQALPPAGPVGSSTTPSEVMELGARLMRSEADKAELSRQLDEAQREVKRLSKEVQAMIDEAMRAEEQEQEKGNNRDNVEGELRARIEELEREVGERRMEAEELVQEAAAEGQQELARLKHEVAYASSRAQDVVRREEQIQVLCRELDQAKADKRELQEAVQLQNEEINRVMDQSRVSGGRLTSQLKRLEAMEKEREAIDALLASRDTVIRELRAKISALEDENDRLRARLAEAGGSRVSPRVPPSPSSQEVIRALALMDEHTELASLRGALEASEEERSQLQDQLRAVTQERDEFQQLCQNLRDEILAVADQTPDAEGGGLIVTRTSPIAGAPANTSSSSFREVHHHHHHARVPSPPSGGGSAYVSPSHVESFRAQVQTKEREVEQLRDQLERELTVRRRLEEESERARMEKEERANVIARELSEAMRQRDQAAHTAHSLETALRRSQERIDHLISENASIKDGLTALEQRIKKPSSSGRQAQRLRSGYHDQEQHLLISEEDNEEEEESSDGGGAASRHHHRHHHHHSLSSEPEWSPSSNAALRAFDDLDPAEDHHRHHDKKQHHDDEDYEQQTSAYAGRDLLTDDDEEEEEQQQQYELAGSWGGRAFLVASSRPPSRSNNKPKSPPQTEPPPRSRSAPGEGARLEVLRMLHSAEMEVQATMRRKLPVDPALRDYIHELKDALKRLEEAEGVKSSSTRSRGRATYQH